MRDPKKKFSIWSIIKDAIGKDLTKFTVPGMINIYTCIYLTNIYIYHFLVFFNEPLSMVQKVTEVLEY